jgi:hypothetical protein
MHQQTHPPQPAGLRLTADTRLSKVVDLSPRVVEFVVGLNPSEFARLRNPLMRRLMAPRITLGRLAAMVDQPVDVLLQQLATLTGATVTSSPASPSVPRAPMHRPAWVAQAAQAPHTIVDLLPIDDALNTDPMLPVMQAVKALAPGEVCCIKHRWETQPLYDVWAKMGTLAWFAEPQPDGTWWIWVRWLDPTPPLPAPCRNNIVVG